MERFVAKYNEDLYNLLRPTLGAVSDPTLCCAQHNEMQLNGFTLELVDQVARCLDDSMDDPNHFSPLSLADTLFVHIYHLLAEATTEAEVSETRLNAYTRDAVARVMTYHGEELSAEELEAADKEVRP